MGKCFINEDVEFDILYSKNERNIIKVNNRKEIFFEVYESNVGDKKIVLEKIGEYGGLPIVTVEFKENGKIYTCEALLEDDDKNQLVVNEENLYFLRDEKNLKNNIYVENTEVEVTSGSDVVSETKLNIEHTYDEKIKEYEDKKFTFLQEIEEQFEGKINVLKDDIGEKLDTFFEKLDKKKEEIINEKLEEVTSDLDNKFSKLKDDLQNIEEFSKNNVNTLLDKKIEDIDSSVNVFLEDLTKNYKEKFDSSDKKSVGNYLNLKNLTEKFNKNKEVYDKKFKDLFEIKNKLNDQDELVVKNNEILEFINDEFNTINNKFLYLTEKENEKYNELLAAVSKKDVVEYKTILKEKIQDVELGLVKEELKDEITQNFKNEIISLKRYAEMTSGGGSVAKQYARGGTMEGTLDITTGEILSAGINITNLLSSAGEADTLADVTGRGATTEITTTFKNLSSADLNVTNNIHASNIISDTGTFTTIDALTANFSRTIVTTTSALSVLNHGTGPALFVRQEGNEPVAHFMDANGDDVVINDDGKVGINTLTPGEKLTVSGNISGNGKLEVGGAIISPTLSTNQTTNLSTADVRIIGQKITMGTSNNFATGVNSFVGGGGIECNSGLSNAGQNIASGNRAATLGGAGSRASGNYSIALGGNYAGTVRATGNHSLAGGGCSVLASGVGSVAIGGYVTQATASNSVAMGGTNVKAVCQGSVAIGGGFYPYATMCAKGCNSAVIGGGGRGSGGGGSGYDQGNKACADCSGVFVGKGGTITSTGDRSAIIGGTDNKIVCPDSIVLGRGLTAGLSSTAFVNNLSAQSTIFEAGNRVCTSEADTLATVTGRGASTTTTTTFNNLSAADLNVTNNIRTCNVFASGGKFTGKVGIGTSSPILPLQVESTINALADTDEPENYHLLLRNPDNDTSEGVGLGFLVSTLTDDVGASIIYKRTGSNAKGELQFYNKQNVTADGAMTQSMTITDVGNLGVGTNVPGERLTVNGNISGNGSIVTPSLSTNKADIIVDGVVRSNHDVKIIGQKVAIGTNNNLATGANSFVGGGGIEVNPGISNAGANKASGNNAATLGGSGTVASGSYSIALGGNYSHTVQATANRSLAGGGCSVLASGVASVAMGGYVVQATGNKSVALGGQNVKAVCLGSVAIGGGNYPYSQMCAKGCNSAVIGGGGRGTAAGSGYDQGNKACADCSGVFVGKGGVVLANGKRSAIIGGTDNKIVCPDSMILGRGLTAGLSSTVFVNNLSAQDTICGKELYDNGNRVCTTAEADTLATVTSRGNTTTCSISTNNLLTTNSIKSCSVSACNLFVDDAGGKLDLKNNSICFTTNDSNARIEHHDRSGSACNLIINASDNCATSVGNGGNLILSAGSSYNSSGSTGGDVIICAGDGHIGAGDIILNACDSGLSTDGELKVRACSTQIEKGYLRVCNKLCTTNMLIASAIKIGASQVTNEFTVDTTGRIHSVDGAHIGGTLSAQNLSATNLAFSKGIDFGNRASNDTLIKVRSDSNDITVFEAAAFNGGVGVCAIYCGSGSGDDNIFAIKTADNANAFKLDQSGDIGLGLAAQDGVNLKVSGCTRLIDDLEVGGNIQTPMISADESKSNIIIGQARPTRNGINLPTNTKHNFSSFISGANISGSQIFGGFRNCIMGQDSTIIGGNTNKIFSSTFNSGYACIGKSSSTIIGGTFNTMLSSVGGNTCNTIIGGTANTVGGQNNIIINGYGSKITSTHPRYSNNRNFIGPSYASCILAGYGGYNQILTGRYNRITSNSTTGFVQRNAIINGIYNCIFGNSSLNTLLGGGSYNQINGSNYNTVGGGSSNCILGGSQTTILGFSNHSTGTRNIILGCRLRVGTDTTLTTVVNNLSSQCNVHVNGQLLGGTCQNKICNSSFTLGESDNGKFIYINSSSGTVNVTVNCMTSGFATRFVLEGGTSPVKFISGSGLSGLNSFQSRTCMTVPFSQADINFRSERYAFLGGNLS